MDKINNYLIDYFNRNYGHQVQLTDNLFENGALDSMGIVGLITELSDQFEVSFEPEDINENNFESIEKISELVSSKQS